MVERSRLYQETMAAAARIRETGIADAQLINTLTNAVRIEKGQARRRRFWAARLVAGLTKDHPAVREAVRALAKADAWHVRYRALRCLGPDTPPPFAEEILRAALHDAHPQVRYTAACVAGTLHLTELVEHLAAYVHSFPSDSSWVARHWLPLLRDGYVLDDRCTNPYTLYVVRGRQMTSRHVTPEELASRGVAAIVAEMQATG
jgi:hypothetical protein